MAGPQHVQAVEAVEADGRRSAADAARAVLGRRAIGRPAARGGCRDPVHMKFRTKSVFALPADRKVKYLVTLPTISDTIASRALVSYHLERHREMMGAFLDSLGITHENGLISEDNAAKPDAEKLRGAAADLSTKFAREDVALYFSTLVSGRTPTPGARSPTCRRRRAPVLERDRLDARRSSAARDHHAPVGPCPISRRRCGGSSPDRHGARAADAAPAARQWAPPSTRRPTPR